MTTLLVDGAQTEVLLAALDQHGVEVSGGSACSSGAVRASHVLAALGEDPAATAMLRCSLGRDTTEADIDRAAAAILGVVHTARAAGTP
jgi:cysteine desulfurase